MNTILNFLKHQKAVLGVVVFVFLISFDPDWSSKGLIFMVIISFFSLNFNIPYLKKKYLLILFLTVVYAVINMFELSSLRSFSNLATTGLCILFFLLVFQTSYKFVSLKIITIFFTLGVFTVGIINLFNFFIEAESFSIFNAWMEYSIFDIHKIYYGAFLNLSFLMLFYLNTKKEIVLKALIVPFPFYLLLLFFTGSVSNILIFILLSSLCISYKYFFSFYRSIYLLLILGPFVILLSLSMPYGKELLEKIEGERSRIRNYEVNTSIILKSPIFGYGIGNELSVMQNARSKKSWEYQNNYNAHNQYFQYLLGGGLIYLILSMLPLFYINIKDKKLNQNLFANGFTLILGYIFLIESFAQRHHGQMFFAFFVTLIILDMNRDKLE